MLIYATSSMGRVRQSAACSQICVSCASDALRGRTFRAYVLLIRFLCSHHQCSRASIHKLHLLLPVE
jgi:hypothetical protein